MKIALAQMKVVAGNVEENLKTMRRMIDEAKQSAADLIVFPEMCTHGYLVGDKWLLDEFCTRAEDAYREMLAASEGIAIAWGSVFLDRDVQNRMRMPDGHHPNRDGRTRRYNAVYVLQNGKPAKRLSLGGHNHSSGHDTHREPPHKPAELLPEGVQPKTLLPNYRIFDDQRYFFSLNGIARDAGVPLAQLVQPFLISDKTGQQVPILFQVCEDMWAEDYREAGSPLNITEMGIQNGAEIVINLSASPWTYGKNNARDRRVKFLQQHRETTTKPFLYVNCVGVQNNGKNFVTFDGGSTVYNHKGDIVQMASQPYEEIVLTIETDSIASEKPLTRAQTIPIAEKYRAIIQGIRSLKELQGRDALPQFVIGLSGGIDSAVVCALLVKAVGEKNVIAVNMPSQWNSEATQGAAAQVASALGISYYQVPIKNMVSSVEKALEEHVIHLRQHQLTGLAKENIQAKIRGTNVLSNIAGNEGFLFTNNGNKLEIALGYATLYGDVGGSIAPIGDLLKTEVFALGHYLNHTIFGHEVIPNTLLPDHLYQFTDDQIQPSAELQENQVDPMKFGYHDALLALVTDYQKWGEASLLRAYAQGTLHSLIGKVLGENDAYGLALMRRWGVDQADAFIEDLEWFITAIDKNVFKRVQAPGIVITSKSAYGFDIRESMLPYYPSKEVLALRKTIKNYSAP